MSRCPSQDWDRYCRDQEAPDHTYLRSKATRARKEHKCDCCPEPITPGTLYERIVYIDNEQTPPKLVSTAWHRPCPADIRADLEEYLAQERMG